MTKKDRSIRWRIAQFFELKWWQSYLKDQEPETYLTWKKKYWTKFLKEIDIQPSGRILDIGCGPTGIFMANETEEGVAIDPLIQKYEKITSIFKPSFYPNFSFNNCTWEEFNSKDTFDYVFAINAFNHFSDLKKSIKKASKYSNKYLILSSDVHNYTFLRFLFRLFPGDILHPQQDQLSDYLRILEEDFILEKKKTLKKGLIFNYVVLVLKKKTS